MGSSKEEPPPYAPIPEQPSTIPPLDLSQTAGPPDYTTVTRDQCIAHLKFLATLSDLRDTVTSTPNLFGIQDPNPEGFGPNLNEARALVKEKRWAVYTSRAVDRYTDWWEKCIRLSSELPTVDSIKSPGYDAVGNYHGAPVIWSRDDLPPLDVLMVWHAHMLNPRDFLEDCIRQGRLGVWCSGFPWDAIDASLDDQTLLYDPGSRAQHNFSVATSRQWDNLQETTGKIMTCPRCRHRISIPWTQGGMLLVVDQPFDDWHGFADKNLRAICQKCSLTINHDALRVLKFGSDVSKLLASQTPMPGTLYDMRGVPRAPKAVSRNNQRSSFPNELVRAVGVELYDFTAPHKAVFFHNMGNVRSFLECQLGDRETRRQVNPLAFRTTLFPEERVAFRRMMSRYWENSSPFALDLVGAVVRQGTFVQKMDNIDWLHSPALTETMLRLTRKYAVFFQIMSTYPQHMAVPTLDVDLAWHTHQLSPARYYAYSIHRTEHDTPRRAATFIDHDDKVSEVALSDGFEWTSKMYRKLTDGQIYSECTCWYCEATRGPDIHRSIRIFPSFSASRARSAAANLHDRPDISSDPDRNPHISAHSAVRTKDLTREGLDPRQVKFLKLRSEYEKQRRREEKRSRKDGKARKRDNNNNNNGANFVPFMWGYPVIVPYYAPFACDPSVHSDAYGCDPSCMSFETGAHGNCAAGTCGGAVAAGSCGGGSGGCAGGCAGGGGSGGGGGGGGGGCGGGGGGGGGGCGGGGGGGGC